MSAPNDEGAVTSRRLPAYTGAPVRRSAGEQAALYIQRLIFDGELKPGERVPQDLVAESLGVSRIPVREALIGLELEGWVTIELNRGAFINAFDEAAVLDHYELYGLLYGFAVAKAMERTSSEELIEPLLELARELKRAKTAEEFGPLSMRFHRLVVDSARSRPGQSVASALARLVPGDFFELVPGAMALERRRLPSIARHVAEGDAATASEEYRRHAREQGELVLQLFKERGLVADLPDARRARRTRPRSSDRM